ncbi:IS66-like element accessory protein TnpA [Azohydromonas australica]|uniref:IS66-like element accessory protein TnpA n=1 Tax=Azohydromonas australica TaxID=364039 RepID=UPI0035C1D557
MGGHDGKRKPATRRRYSAAMKAQVMAECDAPGASVAKVAMAHGINANVVHRWRQLAREDGAERSRPAPAPPADIDGFVPVPLPAPSVVAPVNGKRAAVPQLIAGRV